MTTDTDQPPTVLQLFSSQLFSFFLLMTTTKFPFLSTILSSTNTEQPPSVLQLFSFQLIFNYSPFFYRYQPPPTILQLFHFLLISTNQIPTLTWHGISQLEVFDLNIYHSECDIKIVYLAPFDDEDDNDNGKHSKNESKNHWYPISSSPPAPPW